LIENAEAQRKSDKKFDFIMLLLGIHDRTRYFQQTWDNLKPGGWIEVQEIEFSIKYADGFAQTDSPLLTFSQHVAEVAARGGIDATVPKSLVNGWRWIST